MNARMPASAGETRVVLHRIVITPRTVAEVDGLPLVTIAREEILRARITHGWRTERPIVALVAGAALLLLGVVGLYLIGDFVTRTESGGFPRTGGLAAFAGLFGIPIIYSATRRGLILRIETKRGTRTLQLGSACKTSELPRFIEDAREAGLEIECDDLRALAWKQLKSS